ncbi:MAG: RdgB/HAM1 family non-canonical purine NTP pyrophosphatase [bacterium]|nr:RdgB/HAM1 family non-canonical purine NTP pyrophosphatase [bacterium]
MIPKLIFASHNANKTNEIAALLDGLISVVSLYDIGFIEEIIEHGNTLHENAAIKANAVFQTTSLNCFADDTGLLVDALNGAPGVFSARYAGLEKDTLKNNEKLLHNLINIENRRARFMTVIQLIWENNSYTFEGVLEGNIGLNPIGNAGFGYDPIFIPVGSDRSLAQMDLNEKNTISHRAKAFRKMMLFLREKLKN